jgi:hypothetical protein
MFHFSPGASEHLGNEPDNNNSQHSPTYGTCTTSEGATFSYNARAGTTFEGATTVHQGKSGTPGVPARPGPPHTGPGQGQTSCICCCPTSTPLQYTQPSTTAIPSPGCYRDHTTHAALPQCGYQPGHQQQGIPDNSLGRHRSTHLVNLIGKQFFRLAHGSGTRPSTPTMITGTNTICTTLQEMNHPQPPTPMKTDSAMAQDILTCNMRRKTSKAFDMRFHWMTA